MRTKVCLKAAVSNAAEHFPTAITFGELVDAYVSSKFDGADYRLRKWIEALGERSAWEITSDQLVAGTDEMIRAGYKPSTVNRDISTIGTVYKWAIARKMAPRGFTSPTRGMDRFDEDIRQVEITGQEIQKMLKAANGYKDRRFGIYVRLLYETGCRKGEIISRRWKEVDLEQGQILLPASDCKTGRARVLFFSAETALEMRRIWPQRDPELLIFQGRRLGQSINYRRSWLELTAAIGRPDLHQHDLRHHRAAELLKRAIPLR